VVRDMAGAGAEEGAEDDTARRSILGAAVIGLDATESFYTHPRAQSSFLTNVQLKRYPLSPPLCRGSN